MDAVLQDLIDLVSGFNGFDWVVAGVVVFSVLVGVWRGFGREAISLLGWVVAFIVANLLAKALADALGSLSDNATLRYLVAWGLLFIGVLAVFSVLGSVISKQLRQPGFNIGNRLLGGAFGLLRGLVIMMVVALVLRGVLPDSEEDWLDDATFGPLLEEVTDWFDENFEELVEADPVDRLAKPLDSGKML